jgi:WD40 repeat protein
MAGRRIIGWALAAAAGLTVTACGAVAPATSAATVFPAAGPSDDPHPVITEDGARIRRIGEWIFDVDFSPDGKNLAAADRSGVTGFTVDTFAPVFSVDTQYLPTCVEYSADGRIVAYGTDVGEVHLIDAGTGRDIRTVSAKNSRINSLAFSPDGKRLAAGLSNHSIVLWDTAGGEPALTLVGHDFAVDSLSFSPDGALLASGSVTASTLPEGAVIILWDAADGEVVQRMTWQSSPFPVRPPVGVFFLPGGEEVASLSTDGMFILWDAASGKKTQAVELEFSGGGDVFGLSRDGRRIAVGAISGDISLYDADDGKRLRLNEGRSGLSAVECVSFSPDGNTLASGTVDGALTLWDLNHWR